MSTFSERLRKERITKGYTQKQVAEYVAITYNAISQYESGVREPSLDTLRKLCKFFDVSADYLIGLSEY